MVFLWHLSGLPCIQHLAVLRHKLRVKTILQVPLYIFCFKSLLLLCLPGHQQVRKENPAFHQLKCISRGQWWEQTFQPSAARARFAFCLRFGLPIKRAGPQIPGGCNLDGIFLFKNVVTSNTRCRCLALWRSLARLLSVPAGIRSGQAKRIYEP